LRDFTSATTASVAMIAQEKTKMASVILSAALCGLASIEDFVFFRPIL
jgi:hypothetical protein